MARTARTSTRDRLERSPASADVVEAVLGASRVLLALAARSLAGIAEEVTLPQYRALVVIASRGPQRIADLAQALAVTPSTATRMSDRLVRKGLVRRRAVPTDRRVVRLHLTSEGKRLVQAVTSTRRAEIARILRKLPARDRAQMVELFSRFSAAAGEVPDRDWQLDLSI
jgi:DNA-binding MarR family transcriptional regulator